MKICIDPGHGMSNRKPGVYDPGACNGDDSEAEIVMDWANRLRNILKARGHYVVRTRVDDKDPAPIGKRAQIAKAYGCDILISLHCNAANGRASGTETFYRGEANKTKAVKLNKAVVDALGTKNRGVKTEEQSQHTRLAVLGFPQSYLIELGFIDNPDDLSKLTCFKLQQAACEALADAILGA